MKGRPGRPGAKKRAAEEDSDDDVGGDDEQREAQSAQGRKGKEQEILDIESIAPLPAAAEDHNKDYCEVCHDGGDLICCDFCACAYHEHCLV